MNKYRLPKNWEESQPNRIPINLTTNMKSNFKENSFEIDILQFVKGISENKTHNHL